MAKEITLSEHMRRISPLGGAARGKEITTDELAAMGQKGGTARAAALSKKRRKEIASNAAKAKWAKWAKEKGATK